MSSAILPAASTSSTGSVVPGTIGPPASCISSRARVLEPIASMASAGGPMNVTPASSQARGKAPLSARQAIPGEGRVLGQEAVSGVNRLGPRCLGDLEDLLDHQVALRGRPRPEQVRLGGA